MPLLTDDDIERLAAVACSLYFVTVCCERTRAEFAQRLLVFGYQNACHGMSSGLRRRCRGG